MPLLEQKTLVVAKACCADESASRTDVQEHVAAQLAVYSMRKDQRALYNSMTAKQQQQVSLDKPQVDVVFSESVRPPKGHAAAAPGAPQLGAYKMVATFSSSMQAVRALYCGTGEVKAPAVDFTVEAGYSMQVMQLRWQEPPKDIAAEKKCTVEGLVKVAGAAPAVPPAAGAAGGGQKGMAGKVALLLHWGLRGLLLQTLKVDVCDINAADDDQVRAVDAFMGSFACKVLSALQVWQPRGAVGEGGYTPIHMVLPDEMTADVLRQGGGFVLQNFEHNTSITFIVKQPEQPEQAQQQQQQQPYHIRLGPVPDLLSLQEPPTLGAMVKDVESTMRSRVMDAADGGMELTANSTLRTELPSLYVYDMVSGQARPASSMKPEEVSSCLLLAGRPLSSLDPTDWQLVKKGVGSADSLELAVADGTSAALLLQGSDVHGQVGTLAGHALAAGAGGVVQGPYLFPKSGRGFLSMLATFMRKPIQEVERLWGIFQGPPGAAAADAGRQLSKGQAAMVEALRTQIKPVTAAAPAAGSAPSPMGIKALLNLDLFAAADMECDQEQEATEGAAAAAAAGGGADSPAANALKAAAAAVAEEQGSAPGKQGGGGLQAQGQALMARLQAGSSTPFEPVSSKAATATGATGGQQAKRRGPAAQGSSSRQRTDQMPAHTGLSAPMAAAALQKKGGAPKVSTASHMPHTAKGMPAATDTPPHDAAPHTPCTLHTELQVGRGVLSCQQHGTETGGSKHRAVITTMTGTCTATAPCAAACRETYNISVTMHKCPRADHNMLTQLRGVCPVRDAGAGLRHRQHWVERLKCPHLRMFPRRSGPAETACVVRRNVTQDTYQQLHGTYAPYAATFICQCMLDVNQRNHACATKGPMPQGRIAMPHTQPGRTNRSVHMRMPLLVNTSSTGRIQHTSDSKCSKCCAEKREAAQTARSRRTPPSRRANSIAAAAMIMALMYLKVTLHRCMAQIMLQLRHGSRVVHTHLEQGLIRFQQGSWLAYRRIRRRAIQAYKAHKQRARRRRRHQRLQACRTARRRRQRWARKQVRKAGVVPSARLMTVLHGMPHHEKRAACRKSNPTTRRRAVTRAPPAPCLQPQQQHKHQRMGKDLAMPCHAAKHGHNHTVGRQAHADGQVNTRGAHSKNPSHDLTPMLTKGAQPHVLQGGPGGETPQGSRPQELPQDMYYES
jgi:hypothetical protein